MYGTRGAGEYVHALESPGCPQWVCDALSFSYRCRSGAQGLTGHMHNPGRNIALALAVAGVPSALVCRWSAPVSEPHCVREQASDFERLIGQSLWRLESLVKRVGDFASSGKVDTVRCGEEPTRVFPGAAFEILLHTGENWQQLILTADLESRSAERKTKNVQTRSRSTMLGD